MDDMFVGDPRVDISDVDAMVEFQHKWRDFIPGLKLVIGFSATCYECGNQTEIDGAKYIAEVAKNNFTWFPHTYSHTQMTYFESEETLCEQMELNRKFWKEYRFPLELNYAVAPHHTGVYPVHRPLAPCWKRVWNVSITSTQLYPHLKPGEERRGFIHNGLQALPRQMCELYTKNVYRAEFPGPIKTPAYTEPGAARFDRLVNGGEVFNWLLAVKYNVFMTHQQNYCGDRLALRMFDGIFTRIQKWTTLNVKQISAIDLAKSYFKEYSDEKRVIWTNPCTDKHHIDPIRRLQVAKQCMKNKAPKFVLIGPGSSPTTQLAQYLAMHLNIRSVKSNFFDSDDEYEKGIEHYFDLFDKGQADHTANFDYSEHYFNDDRALNRIKAFLPNAFIIIIYPGPLAFEPIAYLTKLRDWIDAFGKQRIVIVNEDDIYNRPIEMMNLLQKKLNINGTIDYCNLLNNGPSPNIDSDYVSDEQTNCYRAGLMSLLQSLDIEPFSIWLQNI